MSDENERIEAARERIKRAASEPYENRLDLDELRREVRRCWDLQSELTEALIDLPEVPSARVLAFLGYATTRYSEYGAKGRELQRDLGPEAVPFRAECENGAGLWSRIRSVLAEKGE